MSKFPNQLLLVSVAVVALVGYSVWSSERAAREAAEAAHAAAEAAHEAELWAQARRQAEEAAAARQEAAAAPEPEVAVAASEPVAPDTSRHGHGDAGTAPIASIIVGAAVAQTVDSPAIDATGVKYGLGREALPEEVAAWDIDVRPDGQGLPEGSGDVWTGEEVFAENCAVCHGDFGEGVGRWPVLSGGHGSLTHDRPEKTIGSYWPYASTVFDYINRAMPFGNARSLSADDVYAITAYLLYMNDVVEDDFELSHENFAEVRLPNEENFFLDDRAEGELPAFSVEPCMSDCKESVEIVGRAVALDVTPETEEAALAAEPEPAIASPEATPASAEASAALDPALVAEGEKVFRQCKTCHEIGDGARDRTGPALTGIVGSAAGHSEGFRYSAPLVEAREGGLVWTHEELTAFLAKPRDFIRGTKMTFAGLRKPDEIAAVIAYLESVSE